MEPADRNPTQFGRPPTPLTDDSDFAASTDQEQHSQRYAEVRAIARESDLMLVEPTNPRYRDVLTMSEPRQDYSLATLSDAELDEADGSS